MIRFTYSFRIINPLEIIIILFIRFVLNYSFVKRNLLMKKRLRKLLDRVLKHQYRARNYQHYLELMQYLLQAEKHDELTMRNHHQRPVGIAPLPKANYSSKGKEKVDETKTPKNVVNSIKAKEICTRRTNPKTKVRGKEINLSSTIIMVVLIILQRSVIYPNTWLTCTKNPLKRMKKLKDHMKLTSMLHLMRLQLRVSALMKLQSQA
jgi:hypothetical protein